MGQYNLCDDAHGISGRHFNQCYKVARGSIRLNATKLKWLQGVPLMIQGCNCLRRLQWKISLVKVYLYVTFLIYIIAGDCDRVRFILAAYGLANPNLIS